MSEDTDGLPKRDQEAEYTPFPGQPGYRIRPGRSGLDYLDNLNEYYYEVGLFIRYLFDGRLRTRNPFLLISMTLFGILCIAFPVAAFIQRSQEGILISPFNLYSVIGVGLLINVANSLIFKDHTRKNDDNQT
jgi:hypothetical protein